MYTIQQFLSVPKTFVVLIFPPSTFFLKFYFYHLLVYFVSLFGYVHVAKVTKNLTFIPTSTIKWMNG